MQLVLEGLTGSVGPILQQLAQQHLELAVPPIFIERIRQVFMMSRQLFQNGSETENFLYMLDLIDSAIRQKH